MSRDLITYAIKLLGIYYCYYTTGKYSTKYGIIIIRFPGVRVSCNSDGMNPVKGRGSPAANFMLRYQAKNRYPALWFLSSRVPSFAAIRLCVRFVPPSTPRHSHASPLCSP